jgi:hypothetical protein
MLLLISPCVLNKELMRLFGNRVVVMITRVDDPIPKGRYLNAIGNNRGDESGE